MKYTFYIICALVLCCSCQKSWEERCTQEAREITETTCPQLVYNGIWQDSLTYNAQKNMFTYYYRVEGEIDNPAIFEQEKESMTASLKKEIINSIDLKPKKDRGVSFQCIYVSGSTGQIYLDFCCTPADY